MSKNRSDSDPAQDIAARSEKDVAFIEALARVLRENDLAELEVTREYGSDDELQVRLSRYSAAPAPVAAPAPAPTAPAAIAAAAAAEAAISAPEGASAAPGDHPGCVPSPMVGTVYLSPEPGADKFVKIGDRVEIGQTVVIVEAMKTMNQIPSPVAGVVKQILVDNEEPVEYGAPLMIIE